jgi:hypothetical protein
MDAKWKPRQAEIQIAFDPLQYRLYRHRDPACIYPRWPICVGRSKHGEFPLVVAQQHFQGLGYTVWAAEPELPAGNGFILVSFPGKRRRQHAAFIRMQCFFPYETLQSLNAAADVAKRMHTGSTAGGDPDLFVFRGPERFFVEVKWRDQITKKQSVTFPLIERLCKAEIRMARIKPTAPPRDAV